MSNDIQMYEQRHTRDFKIQQGLLCYHAYSQLKITINYIYKHLLKLVSKNITVHCLIMLVHSALTNVNSQHVLVNVSLT